MVHTKFLTEFKALQQRGRRIPIHIQEKVEHEIRSLIDQGHIICLEKCSDQQFISPIVITVKKDQSIKLAMDSKQINNSIHKNKYQMPNSDVLLDNIAQSAQEGPHKPGTTFFPTIDLRYAYSQLPLDETTRTQSRERRNEPSNNQVNINHRPQHLEETSVQQLKRRLRSAINRTRRKTSVGDKRKKLIDPIYQKEGSVILTDIIAKHPVMVK